MPRAKDLESRILDWFHSAPLSEVSLMLKILKNIVKDRMNTRVSVPPKNE